jgi:hypothetical protein
MTRNNSSGAENAGLKQSTDDRWASGKRADSPRRSHGSQPPPLMKNSRWGVDDALVVDLYLPEAPVVGWNDS